MQGLRKGRGIIFDILIKIGGELLLAGPQQGEGLPLAGGEEAEQLGSLVLQARLGH